jgi:dienelactone hydrolase
MRIFIGVLVLALSGCVDLSPQIRWQHAEQLTHAAGWEKLRLPTDTFVLTAYIPKTLLAADLLTVYIEGDGFAWLSRSESSDDPTPFNPVGLQLALRHPEGSAVYLARPCQYAAESENQNCKKTYWTDRRFSTEVIQSTNQAISKLKKQFGARKVVLVGYSGGGAVAALVAAMRDDLEKLVTVAGNLDHRAWTEMHHDTPLTNSLNPADVWQKLQFIPQTHFIGSKDEVVGKAVAEAYASRFPPEHRPELITIQDFDHVCCWIENWKSIWLTGNK